MVVVGGVSVSVRLLLFMGCQVYEVALPAAVKFTVAPSQMILLELIILMGGLVFTVTQTTALAVQLPLDPVTV